MARGKFWSPTIKIDITEKQYEKAKREQSGGCLIADAIRKHYPHFTKVSVDMATIRVTDAWDGKRYTYLTQPDAQHVLLSFDQGWPNPTDTLTIERAVKITRAKRSASDRNSRERHRTERRAELEAKRDSGVPLTPAEKTALTKLLKPMVERATWYGPPEVKVNPSGQRRFGSAVVSGGTPLRTSDNPNLLGGRKRLFGVESASPGVVFDEIVEAEVAKRLAELEGAE